MEDACSMTFVVNSLMRFVSISNFHFVIRTCCFDACKMSSPFVATAVVRLCYYRETLWLLPESTAQTMVNLPSRLAAPIAAYLPCECMVLIRWSFAKKPWGTVCSNLTRKTRCYEMPSVLHLHGPFPALLYCTRCL